MGCFEFALVIESDCVEILALNAVAAIVHIAILAVWVIARRAEIFLVFVVIKRALEALGEGLAYSAVVYFALFAYFMRPVCRFHKRVPLNAASTRLNAHLLVYPEAGGAELGGAPHA